MAGANTMVVKLRADLRSMAIKYNNAVAALREQNEKVLDLGELCLTNKISEAGEILGQHEILLIKERVKARKAAEEAGKEAAEMLEAGTSEE